MTAISLGQDRLGELLVAPCWDNGFLHLIQALTEHEV